MDEPKPLISFETETNLARARDKGYYGYEPICTSELPFPEDLERKNLLDSQTEPINSDMLRDNSKQSKTLLIFIGLFAIAFLLIFIWQILVAKCRVTTLCDTIDESSRTENDYLYESIPFRMPSPLVWLGLTAGTLGLLIASVHAFMVLKKAVGTPRMVELATLIRKTCSSYLTLQYIALIPCLLLFFILIGVGINWASAGAFGIGSLITLCLSHATTSICTRANLRTQAACHADMSTAVLIAFRSGSILTLTTISVALLGISAVYLMFADIRSLVGFALGALLSSFFLRTSITLVSTACMNTLSITPSPSRVNPRTNLNITSYASSLLHKTLLHITSQFSAVAAIVITAAILGSNLPFFYRDPFAICVFNHLDIDRVCGPFGYPQALSYAVYICRNGNMYLRYPTLTTWASNTAFVATPFVIAAATILVSCITTFTTRLKTDSSSTDESKLSSVRTGLRLNMFATLLLLIVSLASITYGLFGSNSSFQSMRGFSSAKNLPRMQLDTSPTRCISKSLNATTTGTNPFPVPQGGVVFEDRYAPSTIAGRRLQEAHLTCHRLFACTLLGLLLGLLNTDLVPSRISRVPDHKSTHSFLGVSGSMTMLFAFANGLVASILPLALTLLFILFAHLLFGAYGVALMATAFICFNTTHPLYHTSTNARITQQSALGRTNSALLTDLSIHSEAHLAKTEPIAALLITTTLVHIISALSNIGTSELVGGPETPPRKLISHFITTRLSDIHALTGLFLGCSIPLFLLALYLRMPHRVSGSGLLVPRVVAQTLFLLMLSVIAPIALVFALGTPGVVAFVISSAGTCTAWGLCTGVMSQWIQHSSRHNDDTRTGMHEAFSMLRNATTFLSSITTTHAAACALLLPLHPSTLARGWISGIIIGVTLVVCVVILIWTSRSQRTREDLSRRALRSVPAPPKRVSPFYEGGIMVGGDGVMVGSQMADCVHDDGSWQGRVRMEAVPGLRAPSVAEINEARSPRGFGTPVAQSGEGVWRDEVREV